MKRIKKNIFDYVLTYRLKIIHKLRVNEECYKLTFIIDGRKYIVCCILLTSHQGTTR